MMGATVVGKPAATVRTSSPGLRRRSPRLGEVRAVTANSTAAEPEPNQAPDSAVLSSNQFDNLLDDATHAVNDMIPDHVLAGLSSDGRTDLLYAINDALTAVLDPYIERKP